MRQGQEGVVMLVAAVVMGLNYLAFRLIGGWEGIKEDFDELPESAKKKQVKAIQIYIGVTIVSFIVLLILPHHSP